MTLGVVPDRPETGYGYIERGADQGRWSLVDKFVEKPDLPTAKRYVESGRHLWNSGMFVARDVFVQRGIVQPPAPAT